MYRIGIAFQFGILVSSSLLMSCVSVTRISEEDTPDNETKVTSVTLGRSDQCTRTIEVRTPIANSTQLPETETLTEMPGLAPNARHGITEQDDATGYSITDDRPALLAAYVPQATPETCYAAALAMIWRAAGIPQTETSFIEAVRVICRNKAPDAASYLQILSAVSVVHEGKRFDPYSLRSVPISVVNGHILTRDGSDKKFYRGAAALCPLPPFLCILTIGADELEPLPSDTASSNSRSYSNAGRLLPGTVTAKEDAQSVNGGLRWNSHRDPAIAGGVFPIRNAADIVHALTNGAYIVAGFHRAGHVVIVDGIHVDEERGAIDRLRVIDPADPGHRQYWIDIPKGRDLDGVSFALSIWNI